jgi:hypothetical protein
MTWSEREATGATRSMLAPADDNSPAEEGQNGGLDRGIDKGDRGSCSRRCNVFAMDVRAATPAPD